jgi:MoxR-like ATPase
MNRQVIRSIPAEPGPPPDAERLRELVAALEEGLVERGLAVRVALLAALAGEHTLLVGPPGTAKSQLARRLHLVFAEARYFERLLTRFTVPEELFGPLSIKALEEDRYERQTEGFLPQASIAFIDEVFKASSAILNSLLTLLNEREFDNGPERVLCPLISVVGATNAIPDDEVGEAFLDRFLVRLPVGPVSAGGFEALLGRAAHPPARVAAPLGAAERDAIWHAAGEVHLPEEVVALLAEARSMVAAEGLYVSDRRWLKIAWLLKIAAASERRCEVSIWDLWLLPRCAAPDSARQASIGAWVAARLGIAGGAAPPRLASVVQALEAQVDIERAADELDHGEDGRLRFRALAEEVADSRGAAFTRKRRYGATHVAARVRQVDGLAQLIEGHLAELTARRDELARYRAQAVWADEHFLERADESLSATIEAIRTLGERAHRARVGFEALPRLAADPGTVPEPVRHELLET